MACSVIPRTPEQSFDSFLGYKHLVWTLMDQLLSPTCCILMTKERQNYFIGFVWNGTGKEM